MEWFDRLAASKKRYEEQKSRGSTPGPAPSAPPPSSRPGPKASVPPSTPPKRVVYSNNYAAALAKAMEESILSEQARQAKVKKEEANLAAAGTKRPVENSALAAPTNAGPKRPVENSALPQGEAAVPIEGFCPLQNILASSCYMNASMQVLYSIPELRQFFLNLTDGEIETSCNMNGCEMEKDDVRKFLKLMQIFFTKMQETADTGGKLKITNVTDDTIDTNLYEDLLTLVGPLFQVGAQADADEFLSRVLQILSCSDLFQAESALFRLMVTKIFTCENAALNPLPPGRWDPTQMVPITINAATVTSVQTGIEDVFTDKAPDARDRMIVQCTELQYAKAENGSFVRNAGKLKEATGPYTFLRYDYQVTPSHKYLFAVLGRKIEVRGPQGQYLYARKLHKQIELNPTVIFKGIPYKLQRAICQLGTAGGGHYICYSFNDRGTPILEFDDDQIRPFKHPDTYFSKWGRGGSYAPPKGDSHPALPGKLINQTATVLLYERIPEALNAGPLPYGPSETNFVPQAPTWAFNTSLVNALEAAGESAYTIALALKAKQKNVQAYLNSKKKGTAGGRLTRRKSKKSKKRTTRRR